MYENENLKNNLDASYSMNNQEVSKSFWYEILF